MQWEFIRGNTIRGKMISAEHSSSNGKNKFTKIKEKTRILNANKKNLSRLKLSS